MNETIDKINSLWMYTKKGKKRVIPGLILMIVGSVLFATIPMMARSYIDGLVAEKGSYDIVFSDLYFPIFLLFLVILLWFACSAIGKALVVDDVSGRKIREALVSKSEHISVASLEDRVSQDVTATMANDVPVVTKMMRESLPNYIVQLALILFITVMMIWLNIYLALVYFLILVVSFTITRRIGDRMHRQLKMRQESMSALSGYYSDIISSHSLVKLYGLEDRSIEGFNNIDRIHRGTSFRTMSAFGFIEPVSRIIDNVGYFVTAILGCFMITNNSLSFGTFIAFISYATIVGRPLASLADSINRTQISMVSYDRILNFLDETEMPAESAYMPLDYEHVEGKITFENVSFSYPDGTKVLNDLSFEIHPGSMVTVVGEEGSGKSTVSDLIMGFRDATCGRVLLDGEDIADKKRKDLRKAIGISPQDPFVFEGSVYYNLSQTASKEDMAEMSQITGFDECVKRLPKGYDTVVGGRGHGLSSGEKQLMSITRLLLYDTKVMIFDESSSEMDPLTSNAVFSAIREHIHGKTVIIVDNTSTSVQKADAVIFLQKGGKVDIGTHSELMDRNPDYVDMYRNMTTS